MESISNMASAAAKAVWPNNETDEARKEPISGESGDTSKGEPYDAGNMDSSKQAEKAPATEPTEDKSETVAPDDTTSGQNDTRDPSNPQTNPDPTKQDVKQEVNVDGPGPAPLENVAKEHGGDAGNEHSEEPKSEDADADADADAGEDEDEDNGIQKHSHGSGTGEQWVKSSGLKADGGDFDAAAPGAGKEADRLLEKKGVKRTGPDVENVSEPADDHANGKATESTESTESKDKPSLGEKIKAKLHVH